MSLNFKCKFSIQIMKAYQLEVTTKSKKVQWKQKEGGSEPATSQTNINQMMNLKGCKIETT